MHILIIFLYIIGYITSYYYLRFLCNKLGYEWDWPDVIFGFWLSLFSWLGLIIMMVLTPLFLWSKNLLKMPKVPKWL